MAASNAVRLKTGKRSKRASHTCPHCLEPFANGDVLWISQHEQLRGDPILGPEADCRFLPSRFTVDGKALDGCGFPCDRLACPRCRLELDRSLIDSTVAFFSLIGAPSSGKSYFLGAMTWQLRRLLPGRFKITFADVDPQANRILNQYEERLFYADDPEQLVAIPKTTTTGDLYRTIQVGEQPITLPRPFLFSLRPQVTDGAGSYVVVLYDNAGEHFYPGQESLMTQATRHLGRSAVLMFLYDPLQDPRFRQRCRELSDDPQLAHPPASECRQETILQEAATRIRRQLGLSLAEKHKQPLIVVVTKSDVWRGLLAADIDHDPWVASSAGPDRIDRRRVEATSDAVRELLLECIPELVTTAEGFAEQVRYVPVSALGTSPVETAEHGLGVRAGSVAPHWVGVPLLYALSRWSKGLIEPVRHD